MRLPNLIIIGAMKCATTSLHYYLDLHPQVSMSKPKELDFFIARFNWKKGLTWYKSQFIGNGKIFGEASVNYTTYPNFKSVPDRMHLVVPQAKLIYILRDPIERIISHYMHSYSNGNENRSFAEAVLNPNCEYICRSQYCLQLEQFLKYYPMSNILLITQENLRDKRNQTMQSVFRFLNVDESFTSPCFSKVLHRSENMSRQNQKIDRPTPDEGLRNKIIDILSNDIDRLRMLTGLQFENWSV